MANEESQMLQMGLLDMSTGPVSLLPASDGCRHVLTEWSPVAYEKMIVLHTYL